MGTMTFRGLVRPWVLVSLFAPACGADDSFEPGPSTNDGGTISQAKFPACGGDACGLPGQDACCGAEDGAPGTTCVDFADFGSTQCREECKDDSDCQTGCCAAGGNGRRFCSPQEFCGEGGIFPEAMCRDGDTCDVANNQSQCIAFFEGCLGKLDQADKTAWFNAVSACYAPASKTCTSLFNCLQNIPSCRF
jgi:hypothetical protein